MSSTDKLLVDGSVRLTILDVEEVEAGVLPQPGLPNPENP